MNRVQAAGLWVLVVLALSGTYIGSLFLHPNRKCPRCRKTPGKHFGLIFRYSQRQCRRCEGTGRLKRLGTRAREAMGGREIGPKTLA